MGTKATKTKKNVNPFLGKMKKRGGAILEALVDTPPDLKATIAELLESLYVDALPASRNGGELSYETVIGEVQEALTALAGTPSPGAYPTPRNTLVSTFSDTCVYLCENGDLHRLGYAINAEGEAEFAGEPVDVTAEFSESNPEVVQEAKKRAGVVTQEAQELIEAGPAGTIKLGNLNRPLSIIEGATLIGPLSSNGANRKRRYSEGALKKIASMAEGLPGYLNHVAPELAFKPRDVKDLAIRHRNVRYDPGTQTVKSDMHVMASHAPLVFGLAEQFGDHIGNSLVSKGVVTMEGDTEVVQDILAIRSADLVSDPASTKGLFEGQGDAEHPITIVDLIESMKHTNKTGGETVDIAAILTHLKDKPEDQKLLAEHYGFVLKADAAKLSESVASITTEREGLVKKVGELEKAAGEQGKVLAETKVELDGFKAKESLAGKRMKLVEAIGAHQLGKEFGKLKDAISDEFKSLLEGMDEATWGKHLDDRYKALKGVPVGQAPRSFSKDPAVLTEGAPGDPLPEGIHGRLASAITG